MERVERQISGGDDRDAFATAVNLRSSLTDTAHLSPQGAVLGFLLALFLFPPVEKGKVAGQEGEEGGETKQKAGKTIKWAGPAPPPGTEVKLMLVVRDDLGMSVGKIAAQCSHAAVGIVQKIGSRKGLMQAWEACGQPKIAVKCKDIDELIALAQAAEKLQLPTYVIQDAGRTEVEPGTTTVLAIGPGAADVINQVTGQLKLLR